MSTRTHRLRARRDYIHVTDLVQAHLDALLRLDPASPLVYNVGVGRGCAPSLPPVAAAAAAGAATSPGGGNARPPPSRAHRT